VLNKIHEIILKHAPVISCRSFSRFFFLQVLTIFFLHLFVSVPDPDPPDLHVLGLQDPDPLVRGIDPDPAPAPDPSIIAKIVRKTLIPTNL
jgi:hypothetical protein